MKVFSKVSLFFLITLIIVLNIFMFYKYLKSPEIKYINNKKVFDEIALSKDYQKQFSTIIKQRQGLLDSLELQMKLLLNNETKSQIDIDKLKDLREIYLTKKKKFEEDYGALSDNIDNEVNTQINQYIKDYSEQKKYDFVMGANGDGSMVYANSSFDITDSVIVYINSRYDGSHNKK